jgi:hypothetical protein
LTSDPGGVRLVIAGKGEEMTRNAAVTIEMSLRRAMACAKSRN